MKTLSVGTPRDEAEKEAVGEIIRESFRFEPAADWRRGYSAIPGETIRVVRRGEDLDGGLLVQHCGQWLGGREVPMWGISAVGIRPEARGTGSAVALVSETLREAREKGVPLSTLFASTQRPYRKAGYEQAGFLCRYAVPVGELPVGDRGLPVWRGSTADREVLRSLRREWGRDRHGHLERSDGIWDWRLGSHSAESPVVYFVGEDEPEGYTFFRTSRTARNLDLVGAEVVALTRRALDRLLTFLADHRSLGGDVSLALHPNDELLLLLPEQRVKLTEAERWLARVTDVPGLLQSRGYPTDVRGEFHLEIEDLLLPENRGRWLLTVDGGRGECGRGGRGNLRVGISAAAPLLLGFLPASRLRRLGWLEGDEATIDFANRVFAGEVPAMSDFF